MQQRSLIMLISCPKCHSIYEIPDDLIGKTGKNFRCQTCSNIWHAMREDALGYEEEDTDDEVPYIEAIPVQEPPLRNFPANKETYVVPADSKSGRRTKSSKEVLATEKETSTSKPATAKKQDEIVLTSDHGTSFTISAIPQYDTDDEDDTNLKKTPHLFDKESKDICANKENRLLPEKPFKGYRKTKALLFLLMLTSLVLFLRREVVAFYPEAEPWYNKILLSGLKNPEYLKISQINVSEITENDKPMIKISAEILNPSRYGTFVPEVTISSSKKTFKANKNFLKAKESTKVEFTLPASENNSFQNLTLGLKRP